MRLIRYAALAAALLFCLPLQAQTLTGGSEVGSFPNAAMLGGAERLLGDQNSNTVNITPAQIGQYLGIPKGLVFPLSIANGGNGTTTPVLTGGANITITGTWPNYTIVGSGGGTPGGSGGQLQFNNSGAFGGFTLAGDCTLSQPDITCTTSGGIQIVTTTGTQTLTNKSISGSEINSGTVGASFLPAALSSSTSVNGVTIPATSSTAVTAPTSTTANNCYLTTTTAGLASTGACPGGSSPGGSNYSFQYNNAGALGGVLPGATGLFGLNWSSLTAAPTLTGLGSLATTTPGTGVATALGVNVGSAGAVVVNGGALGTPSSGVGTNLTGTASALSIGGTAANLSGTPALPNGTTGTTQSVADNTTKLATDAFVLANAGGTPSFSAVTAGTNTAALVVGSGGSITATGTGGITATAVPVGGITGLGTGVGTFLATPTAANLGSAVTGAGAVAGGGIVVSGTWPTQTVSSSYSVRTVSGSTDTILPTDCANGVYYSNAGSVAVTLPQATGSFAGCGVDISASSATTVTITPTTSTINGAATAVVGPSLWDQVVAVSGNYNAYGTAVSFNAGVTYLIDTGTKFTLGTGTGTCASTSALVGGTATGSFECTGTSGASTIVVNLPTAPNGWFCEGNDLTTTSDTVHQTVSSTTSCTLSGTIVANDNINFLAVGH